MPRYTVISAPTFVCGHLHGIGDVVDYDGWPGSTLEPADEVATRIKEHFAANRRSRKFPRKPDLSEFAESKPASRKAASSNPSLTSIRPIEGSSRGTLSGSKSDRAGIERCPAECCQ